MLKIAILVKFVDISLKYSISAFVEQA